MYVAVVLSCTLGGKYIATESDTLVVVFAFEPIPFLSLTFLIPDFRLTPIGYEIGLIKQKRFDIFKAKQNSFDDIMTELNDSRIVPNKKNNSFLFEM